MPVLTGSGDATQAPANDSTYFVADHGYTIYDIVFAYHFDSGAILLPVSGQPTDAQVGYGQGGGAAAVAAEIVQLSAPFLWVTAIFKARRSGQPCQLPDWRPPSQSSKFILKTADFAPKDPTLSADGVTYIHNAEGQAKYLMQLPLTPDDGYPVAAAPYQTLPTAAMGVTPDQFNKTIFPL